MLVSLFNGICLMWGFYAWQPYLLELLGRNAVWVTGVVAALTALATIAGNALVEFFTRFCGRRTSLLTASVVVMVVAAQGWGWWGRSGQRWRCCWPCRRRCCGTCASAPTASRVALRGRRRETPGSAPAEFI
jgi:hypothetical protein